MNVMIKGESEEYRNLRNQLLEAEIALKDQNERVAAIRRKWPAGPVVETDYIFREGPSDLRDESPANFRDVRLSELFAPGKDSLIVDHMMWGPTATRASRSTSAIKSISCWSPKWRSAASGNGAAAAAGTRCVFSPATT